VRTHFGAATATNAYDFNRDGTVNAVDETIARTNRRLFSTALPMIATPKVTLAVESDSPTIGLAGEVIHYRYIVENGGAAALSGVMVTGAGGIAGGTAPMRQAALTGDSDELLEPGEKWLYSSTATVTAAVLTAGTEVVRTATVDTDQTDVLKAVTGSTVAAATGDVFGGVTIRPIAHASFLLTFRGKAIYFDPDSPTAQYAGLPRADYIVITHNHGDHFDTSAIGAIANTNTTDAVPDTKFIVPQVVYNALPASVRPLATILDHLSSTTTPETATFLDDMMATLFSIQAVPAYNTNHPIGQGNGYVVTIDSKRIYVSGDTGAQPELRALGNIDIAFVAMNIPFTMTPAEAASLVGDMEPNVVYPYHYRNQDNTLGNSIAFKNLMSGNFDIEVRLRDWY
jgi:L-ascorbate metabolism protein UlaG (beta-lactamase superfamily)